MLWLTQLYHRLIVRVKAALTQSLLIKTLKIRFTAATKKKKSGDATTTDTSAAGDVKPEGKLDADEGLSKVGKINNLMSTDLEQLTDARYVYIA